MHTQFFKLKALSALMVSVITFSAVADNYDLQGLAEQAKVYRKGNVNIDNEWLKRATDSASIMRGEALELAESVAKEQNKEHQAAEDKARMNGYKYLVFVSYSLNESALNEILTTVSGRSDTAVVFRGVPDGMKIDEGMLKIQRLAMKVNPVPNIILNPELFTQHNISVVPSMVMRSGVNLNESHVSVKGLFDPLWLEKRFAAGDSGDLGVKGPVEAIAERDLIEVMKERVAQVDWNAKKEGALKRYWNHQTFSELPVATTDRVRRIDPTVVVTSDIRTSTGEFVARAGDRVNPLNTRPFTQGYIVFDPLDKAQVAKVKELHKTLKPTVAKVNFLVTQFDRDLGWDSYTAISDELDAPVYLLTSDIRERFQIEKVPSVITGDKTHFIVKEWATQEVDISHD